MPSAAAPAEIFHIHVHSLRLRSGLEALVVRAISRQGVAGYGFALDLEPAVARDMAAWDAAAREAGTPLWRLLGGESRGPARIAPGSAGLDPWAAGSVAAVRAAAPAALLAPHAHPWEIAWCATLAAALGGEATIYVPGDAAPAPVSAAEEPGIGIDWSVEPAFARLAWADPGA
jgi:L-alanine-DL-glutamate epimerase-like enolase superfamily enzyme